MLYDDQTYARAVHAMLNQGHAVHLRLVEELVRTLRELEGHGNAPQGAVDAVAIAPCLMFETRPEQPARTKDVNPEKR